MSNELEKVIEDGNNMKLLLKDDKFDKFYNELTGNMSKNLVKNYSGKDEATKTRIEEQMTMISALQNYINGTIQAGEMAGAELEQYSMENEVA